MTFSESRPHPQRAPQPAHAEPISYDAFWAHYLRAHRHPGARGLHYLGTALGTATLAVALATRRWRLLPLALVAGYAPAWIGHFAIEGNRPATFGHPFWSLFSDYRMVVLALSGRLDRALRAAGAASRETQASRFDRVAK